MLMLKQKLNKINLKSYILAVVSGAVLVGGAYFGAFARADTFDDQIRAIQQDNNAKQQIANQLAAQASSYQDAVNKLQSRINSLQAEIVAGQNESANLKSQIDEQQKELDHQKEVLGRNIKTMYLEGQISTLEILASSKDLSEFVTKEQYRTAVQNQIRDTVDKINQLKQQLQMKRDQVEALIKAQEAQRAEVAANQAEQARMLAYTAAQKASYDQEIRNNRGRIAELRRQQAIANARFNIGSMRGDPNRGGYPLAWHNAPRDSIVDTWGMYNRECVSYTAFKVHMDYLAGKTNRDMPYWGGRGDAHKWDDNARAAGIPVDFNPTPGSIAISNAGTWGHAMYVESVGTVNGQQAIYISQYNAGLDGEYSEGWRYTTGLVFLHF